MATTQYLEKILHCRCCIHDPCEYADIELYTSNLGRHLVKQCQTVPVLRFQSTEDPFELHERKKKEKQKKNMILIEIQVQNRVLQNAKKKKKYCKKKEQKSDEQNRLIFFPRD